MGGGLIMSSVCTSLVSFIVSVYSSILLLELGILEFRFLIETEVIIVVIFFYNNTIWLYKSSVRLSGTE